MKWHKCKCGKEYRLRFGDDVATLYCTCGEQLLSVDTNRAELRPEPTAGDREAAAKLKLQLDGLYDEIQKRDISELHIIVEETIERALSAARGNRAELEAATREFFEAEELEYAAETRTCPKATIGEINEARDRRKAAHDALAAILEAKA